jgi:hypothetical protein
MGSTDQNQFPPTFLLNLTEIICVHVSSSQTKVRVAGQTAVQTHALNQKLFYLHFANYSTFRKMFKIKIITLNEMQNIS